MLNSETKRRIDTARDILVGKVPDPKSQVEQITIALIYKFMDDMDAEAEDLGGVRSFFVGDFEKFSWAKLLSPALGGYDMLNLYSEAVDKMTRNEGVPQLFRDIFKNAYLPYRDPETLKMFLKVINEFNYDHSEKLGDAFEYLLSVLGSQGDAGQFRTPRHIIDFMVKVLDPQKDETILDPACGTAGFLISAYKHIMGSIADPKGFGNPAGLTPEERTKLANNIRGYDISPDMVRLSLVNLYLHGFITPNIYEYDTLTSEERWNDYADVILANPPFMSPKGGIKPHKHFSVQSNRSEVLFVDYMAEHLTPSGRSAIIVPEGIIFQSAGAYKQLRKYLIEQNYLWAVVSLPAGAFNPYSGVKTSILFLDKVLAKKTNQILFVKVEADGFDLGAQRRPVDRNDLPQTFEMLKTYKAAMLEGNAAAFAPQLASALLVPVSRLAESDYILSADRYREVIRIGKQTHPMVKLGDVLNFVGSGVTPLGGKETYVDEGVLFIRSQNVLWGACDFSDAVYITKDVHKEMNRSHVKKNDVLLNITGASIGRSAVYRENREANVNQHVTILRCNENIEPTFLMNCLISERGQEKIWSVQSGASRQALNYQQIKAMQIPLPPLETQRQLVDEIAAHQRIIDGARQVVEGWKPDIELELEELLPEDATEWEVVRLGNAKIEIIDGDRGVNYPSKEDFSSEGYCLFLNTSNVRKGNFNFDNLQFIPKAKEDKLRKGRLQRNDIVLTTRGTVGNIALYNETIPYDIVRINSGMVLLRSDLNSIEPKYIVDLFQSSLIWNQLDLIMSGSAQPQLPIRNMVELKIPLPPLEIQREIVTRIETERAIVHGNRELIRLYEEKVKKVIERVWEG